MEYIVRDQSIITGKQNLKPIFTFSNFPVYIGCTDKPAESDLLADLSFGIDPETGIIQLTKILPLDIVYGQYHSEALGKMWTDHHLAFVRFVTKFHPQKILEIGGSNGFIGSQYLIHESNATWTIIEPNPAPDINPKINVIPKIFDKNIILEKGKYDAIIHSHVFEHMYYPKEFLKTISENLNEGEYHFFSVPNLYEWLKSKFTNCLNFEHTIFLTEYFIDYLLRQYGLKIIKKEAFNNHSIFYATQKTKPYPFNFVSKYDEYLKIFNDYTEFLKSKVVDYNQKIDNQNGRVYLFGAHVFSQVLLNLGLESNRINNILDNSLLKQDKRLYGSNLFVKSPEIIKNDQNPTVILNAGTYQQEISQQLIGINPSVRIIS